MVFAAGLQHYCAKGVRRIEDPILRSLFQGRVHCLENEADGIVFLKDAISIFTVPKPLKNALAAFLDGAPRHRAAAAHRIAEQELDALLHLFQEKMKPQAPAAPEAVQTGNELDRLVLNVSNDCNLRCGYCYAGGGAYGGAASLMQRATAVAAVEQFSERFDAIDKIQLFGGEPLLNHEAIDCICEEVAARHQQGALSRMPKFGVVTNGTQGSAASLALLKKHGISVTISLDGPEEVNDFLRGKGTFRKVESFVERLEGAGIEYGFEATYTSHHLRSGFTVCALLDFFRDHFHQSEVHIPPVSLPSGHPLSLPEADLARMYREAVEYSLDASRDGRTACLSFASRLREVYVDQKPISLYCPAGLATLAVDAAGGVCPCFMLTGKEEFRIGNVHDGTFPIARKARAVGRLLLRTAKENTPACRACWASPFCSGCIGADYIEGAGSLRKRGCSTMRAMAEGFLSMATDLVQTGGAHRSPMSGNDRSSGVEQRAGGMKAMAT
jgi:uncharacterized protein